MFATAKRECTHLTVALHVDPSRDRHSKLRPVLTVDERSLVLKSIRYVDDVITYETEDDLYALLKTGKFDARFLGDDYRDKSITGSDLDIRIHWIDRSHEYSTTRMKRLIHDTVAERITC
jgi:glycerol-3-phosphate cytidylyltransferase